LGLVERMASVNADALSEADPINTIQAFVLCIL
jgi:hypothetical protein